jgi:serine/threonine protein kinase
VYSPSRGVIAERYRLGALVGSGGMGDVYAAEDLRLGRPVAVKLLRPWLADHPDARRRFAREARAAARLSHPNVVQVYDYGTDGGAPYIVMELLPGRTLAHDLLEGPVDEERSRRIAVEVLAALEAAHAQGVLHCDIKPGNVLLSAVGVKVGDFGVAKIAETDQTATAHLVGTLAYTAPERAAGLPATRASDIYAVGVLLYESLTGHNPFTGDTPLAVLRAVQSGEPPPLGRLRPDLSPELVAAVQRAMARDPSLRFESAQAMAAAVAGTAAAPDPSPRPPVAAGPDPSPRPPAAAAPDPSPRPLAAAASSPSPAATEPLGPATRPWPTAVLPPDRVPIGHNRARPARRPPFTSRRGLAVGVAVLGLLVAVAAGAWLTSGGDAPGAGPAQGAEPAAGGPETRSEAGHLPEPLARALERLEEAVQP